jgi:hypothetical protein
MRLFEDFEWQPSRFQVELICGMNPVWKFLTIQALRADCVNWINDLVKDKVKKDEKIILKKVGRGYGYRTEENIAPVKFDAINWKVRKQRKFPESDEEIREKTCKRIEQMNIWLGEEKANMQKIILLYNEWIKIHMIKDENGRKWQREISIKAIIIAFEMNDFRLI